MYDPFPGMAADRELIHKSLNNMHRMGKISDFHHYCYLQPQHNYAVIESAINTPIIEVVVSHLYKQLTPLYNLIKMLKGSEVFLTRLALVNQPGECDSKHVRKTNLFFIDRFIGFSRNRAKFLSEVNQLTSKVLVMADVGILIK